MSKTTEQTPEETIASLRRNIDKLTAYHFRDTALLRAELAGEIAARAECLVEITSLKHLFGVMMADSLPPQGSFWGRATSRLLRELNDIKKQQDELRKAARLMVQSAPIPDDVRLLLLMSGATQETRPALFEDNDHYKSARAALAALLEAVRD